MTFTQNIKLIVTTNETDDEDVAREALFDKLYDRLCNAVDDPQIDFEYIDE